ncbi:STAS domain-containing protein [Streptomyces tsukubensis]|uniref:Anti-sigma factor antagonist n=1 Tax=Streptomyces tsukubensis TaxID=83656 RepID=A0A1V4A876_9ACTN|nr:STAS domain-containing protein [Streptomyces tsukubensis]OON78044.1 anti-anti-sigma factor [Streptomyces tsukubensis]QFR98213.1 anti-sigma factor antagonist [Streptomyces tsukubensis]
MSFAMRRAGDDVVLAVGGEMDLDNVEPLDSALQELAATGEGAVVLDLSGVAFADSTTVNVLLRAHSALGPRLRLAALSPFMERLLGLIGLDGTLTVYRSVEDALAGVPAP